jgi:acyl-CoA thioesterase-1
MESRLIAGVVALTLLGCGGQADSPRDSTAVGPSLAPDSPAARKVASVAARPTVVFLGTSLTAGLGVDPDQAYPALIQGRIDSAGLPFEVQNRGNSGETSAGALARLGWILQAPPRVLVIETGANDGLRGQDPDSTKANIQGIIDRTRARDSTTRIVLVQMEAMPNLGRRYVARFHAIYPELATRNRVTLIPFLLDGVAGVDSLNQADGIHPTPKGHERVAANVWQALRPTLTAISAKGPR